MEPNISWINGITVKMGKEVLYFDPSKKNKKNQEKVPIFISHAHSDHLGGLGSTGKCHLTKGTLDILSQKYEKKERDKKIKNVKQIKYGNSVKINDIEIIAHNAGHMLGSAQYEIKGPESTTTYTGDINYRKMETTDAAVPLSSDVLIIEATYGDPRFKPFPTLNSVCTRLIDWTTTEVKKKKMPVFNVYSAGKAQEIIKILNNGTTLPIVTQSKVTKICKAYVKNGVKLTYVDSTNEEGKELLRGGECVFVTSSYNKIKDKIPYLRKWSLAAATGWAAIRIMKNYDAAFILSSHADFKQLVEYVKASKPRRVFTIFGSKEIFAEYIEKKLGINANPLNPPEKQKPSKKQKTLSAFY
jgi:putative mRNA 3-end processing factor